MHFKMASDSYNYKKSPLVFRTEGVFFVNGRAHHR